MGQLWTNILAGASAFVLLSNAIEKIVKAVKAAKAPNEEQNKRLTELENWKKTVEHKLAQDKGRLDDMDAWKRATTHAFLALLDHGIDGNNIKQMQDAKKELQEHLINR